VGRDCRLLTGALLSGGVVLGDRVTVRCEMRCVLAMDDAEAAHHGFVGGSVLGHGACVGPGAVLANRALLGGDVPGASLVVAVDGGATLVDTGIGYLGAIMGDACEIGSNAATEVSSCVSDYSVTMPVVKVNEVGAVLCLA
jgi:NDP-sugar pyrophosphorylase family protein